MSLPSLRLLHQGSDEDYTLSVFSGPNRTDANGGKDMARIRYMAAMSSDPDALAGFYTPTTSR